MTHTGRIFLYWPSLSFFLYNKLINKIVINQVNFHWPSYRASVCCIGHQPSASDQYSRLGQYEITWLITLYYSKTALVWCLVQVQTELISLVNPVSLGLSSPLISRRFITDTNSLLLNWPSSESKIEPQHEKTNKMICAPSRDSHQPGHPPSLTES